MVRFSAIGGAHQFQISDTAHNYEYTGTPGTAVVGTQLSAVLISHIKTYLSPHLPLGITKFSTLLQLYI